MTLRHRTTQKSRHTQFKSQLNAGKCLSIVGVYDGLSGIIANNACVDGRAFDALWISSFADSAAKGHPDIGVISTDSRIATAQEILHVTNKPLIFDGDTGGDANQFAYLCNKLETIGVSAIIIEDQKNPKRNSLALNLKRELEDPHVFAQKIAAGKAATNDFMVVARIESFIAGLGLEDAIARARVYLASSADGLMIHSNATTAEEVFAFMQEYQVLCNEMNIHKPVFCVPTTYCTTPAGTLANAGISAIIYANQILRAAHQAMSTICQRILTDQHCDHNDALTSIKTIFDQVGMTDIRNQR